MTPPGVRGEVLPGIVLGADRALKSGDVVKLVSAAITLHGAPKYIRSDNGSEFIAKEIQR
jgi:hypothetical protein